MAWKSRLPEDMAGLIETLRRQLLSSAENEAGYDADDEDLWDDDPRAAPESICVHAEDLEDDEDPDEE